MQDQIKYPVLLGRLLELMGKSGDVTDDHRSALRALVELCSQRSASIQLDERGLVSEGVLVPGQTPFIPHLRERMTAHGLARVALGHGASPVDIVTLLRALVRAPGGTPGQEIEEQLRAAKVTTVSVVTADMEAAARQRPEMRVSEAFVTTKGAGERPSGTQDLLVPAHRGAAYEEMVRQQRAQANTLVAAVSRLQEDADQATLLARLDQVQAGILKAVTGNELNQALEAILRLIRQEGELTSPDQQRAYGIALRRILTSETIKRFAPYACDEVYHEDIVLMMRRAGTQGTKVLTDLLIDAPSQAERRSYLSAIRKLDEGSDVVTSLLQHHQWYVVRNAADLVGEMRLGEAVPPLSRQVQHADGRVRRSVGLALARIGTPDTALHLRKLITDPDRDVRMSVVKEIGGRAMSGLAMPLVSAAEGEEDPEVLAEYYRALGRIGTPEAVQALLKPAQSGGSLLARKPQGPRLAAIEALGTAGGATAIAVLRELAGSRGDVGAVATAALERASSVSAE